MKKIIFSAALVLSLGLAGCGETKKKMFQVQQKVHLHKMIPTQTIVR